MEITYLVGANIQKEQQPAQITQYKSGQESDEDKQAHEMIIRELWASAIVRAGAELRSKVPAAIYENLAAQYPVAQRQPSVRFPAHCYWNSYYRHHQQQMLSLVKLWRNCSPQAQLTGK